jgi:hypothetical protein
VIASTTVVPVARALERSTEIVPSTTQKPFCASVTLATRTASASPAAPRTLLRNQTERKPACEPAMRRPSRRPLRVGIRVGSGGPSPPLAWIAWRPICSAP